MAENVRTNLREEGAIGEAEVAEALDLLRAVTAGVQRADARRPCDWAPWVAAYRTARHMTTKPHKYDGVSTTLMVFAQTLAGRGWAKGRTDCTEYAICFLESDVMLHRSGYTKRTFVERLRRVALEDADVARLDAVFRERITQGAGREEFRAYVRLAAKLTCEGRMPEFEAWVREAAKGAALTSRTIEPADWARAIALNEALSEADKARVTRGKSGVVWPDWTQTVSMRGHGKDPGEQGRRNAYRFESAIRRRRAHVCNNNPRKV